MSKAKELATSLQKIIEHQKGDWHELKATAYDLIDAVLSEPDPSTRIAELEAEVERLKDIHKAKWVEAYSRICPDITQEGEG